MNEGAQLRQRQVLIRMGADMVGGAFESPRGSAGTSARIACTIVIVVSSLLLPSRAARPLRRLHVWLLWPLSESVFA